MQKLIFEQEKKCCTVTFSLQNRQIDKIDEIAMKTNRSRSNIVQTMIDFSLENCEIEESENFKNPCLACNHKMNCPGSCRAYERYDRHLKRFGNRK